jgi:phosphocarrier protein HPr
MSVTAVASIRNERGLHARAAAKFVKLAMQFQSDIEVSRGPNTVSGRSIMGLMMLAASPGSEVKLTADGPDEDEALAALCALIANNFEED